MYHVYSAGLGETKEAYIFKHIHPHRKKHNELHTHTQRERERQQRQVCNWQNTIKLPQIVLNCLKLITSTHFLLEHQVSHLATCQANKTCSAPLINKCLATSWSICHSKNICCWHISNENEAHSNVTAGTMDQVHGDAKMWTHLQGVFNGIGEVLQCADRNGLLGGVLWWGVGLGQIRYHNLKVKNKSFMHIKQKSKAGSNN